MKIARVDAFALKLPEGDFFGGEATDRPESLDYVVQPGWRGIYSPRIESMIVRIETDSGRIGWGEGQSPIAPEISATVVETILKTLLVGRDALATQALRHEMYALMNLRGHGGGFMIDAIAGVDMALWDLKGKALGAPLYALLGGPFRRTIPCYVSGVRGESIADRVADLRQRLDLGFRTFKLFGGFGVETDVEIMAALLDQAPKNVAFDALWRYDRNTALRLGRQLEQAGALWFEAPCEPEDVAGHAGLARALDLPIAGGETERTRLQFKPWLDAGAFDIAQPDIGRCGVSEGVRIVDLAELMNVPVTLHCGIASPLMIAASLHVAAAHPHVSLMEYQPVVLNAVNRLLKRPLLCREGSFELPEGPGLGIELDEAVVRRHARRVGQ
ncbi:MAG: mandelate racemase/muconate lactonizing enzyme family protein [Proteobacteria bacterium]|nr:mandelate racemase/muconate lactonizing enzyme family protein [Pseudomonadota bacterium]